MVVCLAPSGTTVFFITALLYGCMRIDGGVWTE